LRQKYCNETLQQRRPQCFEINFSMRAMFCNKATETSNVPRLALQPIIVTDNRQRRAQMKSNVGKALALLAAGAALVALASCSAPDAATPKAGETAASTVAPASLTVSVEPVSVTPFVTSFGATGNVAAWQSVSVSAEVSGLAIREVLVVEGDLVKKGDVLARLATDQLQAEVDQQIATNQGRAASVETARLANERGAKLLANNAISQEDVETRQTTLATAQSSLAEGQAALKSLQVQLAEGTIVAPVDGRIAAASPTLGGVVSTGTELFKINQDDRLEVQAKVPEQYLSLIKPGQTVSVTEATARTIPGEVRAVAEQVDQTTRLGTVYVSLPAGSGLRTGMSAEALFKLAGDPVLTIPEASLAWRDNAAGVFVIDASGVAAFRKVTTGAHQDGRVAVTDGLVAGQKVAIDGVGFLNDGTKVGVASADQTVGS